MKRGGIAALSAALVLCVGVMGVVLPGAPAGAAVPTDHKILSGNFAAGPRDEFFLYNPGAEPEAIFTFAMVNGAPEIQLRGEFTVNGTYTPLVGDFDADGFDEILWYAPGTTADFMWNFTSYTTVQSRAFAANGNYPRPVVGDFTGDFASDILWYAPGSAADFLWDFNAGGGFNSARRVINGNYRPVSGSIGNDRTDDIFWYAPGSAGDFLWDFTPGSTSFTTKSQTVNGASYLPFSLDIFNDGPGNHDIFWYAPGTTPDTVWDWFKGQRFTHSTTVDGEFLTAPGDFFGDGFEDVVFENDAELVLREHRAAAGGGVDVIDWVFTSEPPPPGATARAERSPALGAAVSSTPGIRASEGVLAQP